jgi:putative SOS response-associated peptidase YedK
MCGRYVSKEDAAWERYFSCIPAAQRRTPFASYNIAPTDRAPVIVRNKAGERELALMRWGLAPSWAKDLRVGSGMINARAETVTGKPAFRDAFKYRRCLVPANGYYEWRAASSGAIPHFITSLDRSPLAFAGLWEHWTDKGTGEITHTFTIATCEANSFMAPIHDRMPVILAPDHHEAWLTTLPVEALKLLSPYQLGLKAYPVSKRVNSVRNNGEELIRQGA